MSELSLSRSKMICVQSGVVKRARRAPAVDTPCRYSCRIRPTAATPRKPGGPVFVEDPADPVVNLATATLFALHTSQGSERRRSDFPGGYRATATRKSLRRAEFGFAKEAVRALGLRCGIRLAHIDSLLQLREANPFSWREHRVVERCIAVHERLPELHEGLTADKPCDEDVDFRSGVHSVETHRSAGLTARATLHFLVPVRGFEPRSRG